MSESGEEVPGAPQAAAASMFALVADIATAFVRAADLAAALGRCAECLVAHLDAAFARVWTLDEAGRFLLLRASAGLYTHLDGGHARVEVGRYKIGTIARDRRPHLTNSVVGDPLVHDQEWARREGMVAFAGYPLVAGDRLVGVMAMFARHPFAEATLAALGSVAEVVTVGIERAAALELRVSKERAEEAARAQAHALHVVAHELRGPVTVLRMVVDRAARGGPVSEADRERLDRQVRRLTLLAEDLTAASRQERGQLEVAPRPIDLCALVAEAVADARERSPGRRLEVSGADRPCPVRADPARIGQVVGNLVDNALKYSPEGTPVEVRLGRDAGEARVEVVDCGPGIPPEQREAIFAPFVRVGHPAAADGLGLGLHICRTIVARHGGRVGVECPPDGGSTFWFTLPCAP